MYDAPITPAETITGGAIRAVLGNDAAHASLEPALVRALDGAYGRLGWFLYWDEDLSGHPIRGTLTVSFAGETLVVG